MDAFGWEDTATPPATTAKGPAPWDFSTYGQWRAANDGNLEQMWAQIGDLQPGSTGYFGLSPDRLQEAGQSFGLNSDQLLKGLFDLQTARGRNTADTWNLNQNAGGFLAPVYVAGMAYKQLGLPDADKVMQTAQQYQHGPWGAYVDSVQDAAAKARGGSDLGDFVKTALPIALMAVGVPDFFSQFGGAAMTTDLAAADMMAGLIPEAELSAMAGTTGGWGDLGGFGGGSNWGDFSSGDLGDWGNLGGFGGGPNWGPAQYAPEIDLSKPFTNWGSPDMGATFSNWLSDPMAMLKKLRSMSPLAGKAGPLQSGMNILQGLHGINQSRQLSELATRMAERSDPFGPYRGQYAQQLAALSANPSLITKQPGYAAGLEAVRRSLAAQGYQGSGNMMAALAQYGQKFLGDEQTRLATLAGAGFNPASAGQISMAGNISAAQLLGSSLNRLGGGMWQLLS